MSVRDDKSVHLELHEHHDLRPFETPYTRSFDFVQSWWNKTDGWTRPGVHALYFMNGGLEAARARVIENAHIEPYWSDFDSRQPTIEIDWLEASVALPPRSGVGRVAVSRIREEWPNMQVVARSMKKDYFWGGRGVDFVAKVRTDSAERVDPLFVAPPLL